MCLHDALSSKCLSYCSKHMVLYMTWLHMVRVSCYKGHVLALFIFETDFPAVEKLWPRLDISELGVLERSLELATDNIFQTVVGDDVVVGALVLDRDGLLHQTAFLELVAVDQGAAESPLLIGCQALSKVGVDLGVCVAW